MASLTPELLAELSKYRVTASLVVGSDGRTVNASGNSKGLGNQADLELLKALRRQSQVVLTSGLTYREEQYKFPSSADLAVLTRSELTVSEPAGRKFTRLSSGYCESLDELSRLGYERIQVEYGITGIQALMACGKLDALLISSQDANAVIDFCQELNLSPAVYSEQELVVGLVAWQRG